MNKLLGGVLLVSGTTIGAAMLALPTVTGLAGFIPALVLFVCWWAYMTYTALLMLEVNLWMEGETNMSTMAHRTLGRVGEIISWILYLVLLYLLLTAFMAGGGEVFARLAYEWFGLTLPMWLAAGPLYIIFAYFVYRGVESVDYLNRLLMIGLVATFFILLAQVIPDATIGNLSTQDWLSLPMATSLVVTSFGYHIIIPTLTTYLDRDVKLMRKTIIIGSTIPLFVYALWTGVALAVLPLDIIKQGYHEGANGALLLAQYLDYPAVRIVAICFSFFAIVSTFLGVALSLLDFLADGLKVKKTHMGRAMLCLIIIVPPMFITLLDPRAFLSALDYAGAFGVVTLLGILPALMVWKGRYAKGFSEKAPYRAFGGKGLLASVVVLGVLVVVMAIAVQLGIFDHG